MNTKHTALGVFLALSLSALAVFAQGVDASSAKPSKRVRNSDEGERVFKQQCSRCHAQPESFSPRISGTVVRHMRVRASLSQHEEEQLLRFFNP